MGCFCGRLISAASDQKLFCKLCSPFCCSFDEFVEEKVISPSYSSAILTPPPPSTFKLAVQGRVWRSSHHTTLRKLSKILLWNSHLYFRVVVLIVCILLHLHNPVCLVLQSVHKTDILIAPLGHNFPKWASQM